MRASALALAIASGVALLPWPARANGRFPAAQYVVLGPGARGDHIALRTTFGLIVSVICCKKGFYASGGARGVGEATAKAVVSSIVAIFAADYMLTTVLTEF